MAIIFNNILNDVLVLAILGYIFISFYAKSKKMTIKEAIQDIKGWFVGEENEQNTK
jgi:hypothetical protein